MATPVVMATPRRHGRPWVGHPRLFQGNQSPRESGQTRPRPGAADGSTRADPAIGLHAARRRIGRGQFIPWV